MNGIICLNAWYSVLKDFIFALIYCDWFKIEHFKQWLIKKRILEFCTITDMNLYTQFQFWILFDVLIAKAIHYQCFMLHNPCHNIQIKKWCKIFLQQNYEGEDANCQTLIWAFDLKFTREGNYLKQQNKKKTLWKQNLTWNLQTSITK